MNSHRYLPVMRVVALFGMVLISSLSVGSSQNLTGESESTHAVLQQMVSERIYQEAMDQYPDAEVSVDVSPLDPRIQLAECTKPSIAARGQRRIGRVPVAVSCAAPSWTVFMKATVNVEQAVIVASRALPRGSILSKGALTTELRDLSRLRQNHFLTAQDINGLELKRPLNAGAVIYASMVKVPIAIRRGDRVVIVANRGSVNISVPGESLQNGMPGEQIRVRNQQSEKIVYAWVSSPGVVTTNPTGTGD